MGGIVTFEETINEASLINRLLVYLKTMQEINDSNCCYC